MSIDVGTLPELDKKKACPKCGFTPGFGANSVQFNFTFSDSMMGYDGEVIEKECADCGYTDVWKPLDFAQEEPEWVVGEGKKSEPEQTATNILNEAAQSVQVAPNQPESVAATNVTPVQPVSRAIVAPVVTSPVVKPQPRACCGCPIEKKEGV